MNAKLPAVFEAALRSVPVDTSRRTMSAPLTTAPVVSRTIPLIAAEESCAAADDGLSNSTIPNRRAKKRENLAVT